MTRAEMLLLVGQMVRIDADHAGESGYLQDLCDQIHADASALLGYDPDRVERAYARAMDWWAP